MGTRLQLSQILRALLGTTNVYFQPPDGTKMKYPCIKYELDGVNTIFANNKPHRSVKRYAVTVIDPDPDSPIPDKVGKLPMCRFDRPYTADNLNHWVYNLYY